MNLIRWTSPTQQNEEAAAFRYRPLRSANGIRLCNILPGSGNTGIAITLVDSFVTGATRIAYDALSYTWGDGARTRTILCNDRRLKVTHTLWVALHRFRDPVQQRTLWIDQICICQERVSERNRQVQMMGDIFQAARKVIVWLGDDYDDSRAGMQLAKHLLSIARTQPVSGLAPSDLEFHGLPKQGHKRWKALAAILTRPWFWRTWVVQEVVLNPSVEIVLGRSMLTWDELEMIVGLLEEPMPKVWQLNHAISISELPFSRINRIRLRHRRVIFTPISPTHPDPDGGNAALSEEPEAMFDSDEGHDPELLDLLLMSRGLGATDPRDKIYALLGLVQHDIDPDYTLSPETVFTEFALQTVGLVTHGAARRGRAGRELSPRDREVRRAMVLLACAGRQNQKLQLPSWVPDWTVSLSSRPLVFGLGQTYSAGGTRLGIFDWQPDFGLQLSGILLDTVQVVGSTRLDLDSDGPAPDPHQLISAWWLEAQRIAAARVIRLPGSTPYTDAFEAMRRRLSICKHGYYIGDPREKRRHSLLEDAEINPETLHNASQTMTLGPTRGRVMAVSSSGFLGLVPLGTREGDMVFIIRGADVPFVLRSMDDAYELIGEAYVQGVMNGEALEMDHLLVQDVMIK